MNETSMLPQRKPRLATPWGRLVRAGVLTALALTLSLGPCGAPIADAADDKRQDNVFGTVDEGMSIGTNPQTGDNEMRIESPPPPISNNMSI